MKIGVCIYCKKDVHNYHRFNGTYKKLYHWICNLMAYHDMIANQKHENQKKKSESKKIQYRPSSYSGIDCINCYKDSSICKCGRDQILEFKGGYTGDEENYCGGY